MPPPPVKPLLSLTTTLGARRLEILEFGFSDELGRLFEGQVIAVSDDAALNINQLLGTHASVALELPDGSQRHFDGVVAAVGREGMQGRRARFRLVLRPWLWLLTRRADTRVFQDQALPDLLKAVFAPYKHDLQLRLSGSYAPLPYCVQYRETDFNFVSRLMEQEGVYYHFEHSAGRHVMHVLDQVGAHKPVPGFEKLPFRDSIDGGIDLEAITQWHTLHEVQSSELRLTDYNFTTPSTDLAATHKSVLPAPAGALEVYDPPGDYTTTAEGSRYARLRMEELDARHTRISGHANVRSLTVGTRFTLTDHPVASQNADHLVVAARIDASQPGQESGHGMAHFGCAFACVPASVTWRPARSTPKPVVPGPQTAVVVGKSGEEIWTDQYGRVKVQFHWDRLGKKDEKSSCWLRVASPVAGKGFGFVSVPRIGQEVVVSFLEGDPDRPLITGSVYNATQVVPYALPANATVATWKTHSSKGGGASNFNELRFEDKKGSEYVWFQAEKDFYQLVKNDAWQVVGNDQFRLVKKNLQEEIQENVQRTVGKDQKEKIGGNLSTEVAQTSAHKVGQKFGLKVGADLSMEAGAGLSLKSAANTDQKVGANLGIDAAANVHIKAGANLVIEAGAMITLKAGGGSVVIGPANVAITGAMVQINSGGGGGSGGGASPKAPEAPEAPKVPKEPKDPLA